MTTPDSGIAPQGSATQPAPESASESHNERRFEALVQPIEDYAIFLLDTRGHVASWNRGAARIKGYAAHEIIGEHFSRFYTEEAKARRWPDHELEQAALHGRFNDEGWRVRKDGTMFWANVVITALRESDGSLSGFAKVTRDLTAERRQVEALRLSEERFRLLVESVSDHAIFMLDPQGNVVSWNSGATNLKGYRPAEIVGQHFSVFYPPEEVAAGLPELELRRAHSGNIGVVSVKQGAILIETFDDDSAAVGAATVSVQPDAAAAQASLEASSSVAVGDLEGSVTGAAGELDGKVGDANAAVGQSVAALQADVQQATADTDASLRGLADDAEAQTLRARNAVADARAQLAQLFDGDDA